MSSAPKGRPSTRSAKSLNQYASLGGDASEDESSDEYSSRYTDTQSVASSRATSDPEPKSEDMIDDEGEVISPDSARLWPKKAKVRSLLLYSLSSFLVSIAQSMILPAIETIGRDLNGNPTSTASVMTLPLIVLGIMNLIVSPFSDRFGRKAPHVIGLLIFTGASIGCAFAKDIFFLLGFRLVQALGGSAPTIVGAGAVSDMFTIENRGRALSMFLLGPLIGPVMGPIFGGLLSSIKVSDEFQSWRIIFYVVSGCGALLTLLSLCGIRESLPKKKVEETGCLNPFSPLAYLRYLRLTLMVIMLAISFSGFFVVNITFPKILTTVYGLDTMTIGLCYLPFGVGLVLGAGIGGRSADRLRRKGGTPEHRLIPSLLFIPLNGIGVIAQGWVFETQPHLAVTLVVSFFLGLTFILPRPGTNTFVIERLKILEGKDVASAATGLVFGIMLPVSAVVAQLSVQGIEEIGYGYFLTAIGGALILSNIPISVFVIRDIRRSRLRKQQSLLNPKAAESYDSIN